jgi:hypothetical protein
MSELVEKLEADAANLRMIIPDDVRGGPPLSVLAAARIRKLEEALRKIDALNVQTHHVTDSTMRQHETECLSRYFVREIIAAALKDEESGR